MHSGLSTSMMCALAEISVVYAQSPPITLQLFHIASQSGYIELSELVHFGAAVGAGWTPAACEKLLGCMDTSGDRKISLSEVGDTLRHACASVVPLNGFSIECRSSRPSCVRLDCIAATMKWRHSSRFVLLSHFRVCELMHDPDFSHRKNLFVFLR